MRSIFILFLFLFAVSSPATEVEESVAKIRFRSSVNPFTGFTALKDGRLLSEPWEPAREFVSQFPRMRDFTAKDWDTFFKLIYSHSDGVGHTVLDLPEVGRMPAQTFGWYPTSNLIDGIASGYFLEQGGYLENMVTIEPIISVEVPITRQQHMRVRENIRRMNENEYYRFQILLDGPTSFEPGCFNCIKGAGEAFRGTGISMEFISRIGSMQVTRRNLPTRAGVEQSHCRFRLEKLGKKVIALPHM